MHPSHIGEVLLQLQDLLGFLLHVLSPQESEQSLHEHSVCGQDLFRGKGCSVPPPTVLWHPSPWHCWQWGALCLPTMLGAGPSPGVPKASLCPPHLLALLILPQVEGPFGQGQPVLVDLGGGDGGSG